MSGGPSVAVISLLFIHPTVAIDLVFIRHGEGPRAGVSLLPLPAYVLTT